MFLLVPAYPGSPGPKAVRRLCVCLLPETQVYEILMRKKSTWVQQLTSSHSDHAADHSHCRCKVAPSEGLIQIYQCLNTALNKPVFSHVRWLQTWHCPHLLLSDVLQLRATTTHRLTKSCSSAVAMGQTDSRTNRWKDTIPLLRPCFTYYVGSANNAVQHKLILIVFCYTEFKLMTQTHTHNRLTAFVWDNQGRPVPEETLTHSHPT